jgi:5'-deoxynucleotidase YfbR-like HD superfamily hydrolase
MTTEDAPTRAFAIPFRSITMSERRLMASKFGVNWDAIEVDMTDIPRPVDSDNPTEAEQIAAAKAFTKLVGPNERFALLFVAVKRQIPTATEAMILEHADAGDWVLQFSADEGEEAGGSDPLPPPTEPIATS